VLFVFSSIRQWFGIHGTELQFLYCIVAKMQPMAGSMLSNFVDAISSIAIRQLSIKWHLYPGELSFSA